ncbi:TPA: hypothetical protein DDW35_10510 [Candidatus Sumerlaeota bacterium]|nr:hypothetical protein [Candidatus Sumerlaeota bacterium]
MSMNRCAKYLMVLCALLISTVWADAELMPPEPSLIVPPSVLYYSCDDTTGSLLTTSSMFPGKLEGCMWMAGKINGALRLDGRRDNVRLGAVPIPTGDFSISVWVKPASEIEKSYRNIISRECAAAQGGRFRLYLTNQNKLGFYMAGAETADAESEEIIDPCKGKHVDSGVRLETQREHLVVNEWAHVAVSRFHNQYKLFLNGKVVAETTSDNPTTFDPGADVDMRIGASQSPRNGGPEHGFNGWIDEIRIVSAPLSASNLEDVLREAKAKGWQSAFTWTPTLIESRWKDVFVDLTPYCLKPGTYDVLFEQTGGTDPMEMRFLSTDKTAKGYELFMGPNERQFRLEVRAGAAAPIGLTASLRGSGQNDTMGEVLVRRVQ